jgi:hypothetical protein
MREAYRDKQERPVVASQREDIVNGRRVALRFASVEGRLVCIGLEIGPPVSVNEQGSFVFDTVDDAELDALRSTEIRLPLRELVDKALESAALAALNLSPEVAARFEPHRAAARKSLERKPGRPPQYSDDHYREVARIYEETLRSGRRDPLQACMRELRIEKTTAANKVREARRRGFLTMDYFKKETADA